MVKWYRTMVKPNYSKLMDILFAEVVQFVMSTEKRVNISLCGQFEFRYDCLPWIPDFSTSDDLIYGRQRFFSSGRCRGFLDLQVDKDYWIMFLH